MAVLTNVRANNAPGPKHCPVNPYKETHMSKRNPQALALSTLRHAAHHNTASTTLLDTSVYTAAGATSVWGGSFLAGYNSALDSAAVRGIDVSTAANVQTIVDAYNTIVTLSRGYGGVPLMVPTAAQFAAIGVTGVQGTDAYGTALHLLNQCIFGIGETKVDSVAELQAMANAAKHLMDAAGGTNAQAAALTLQDFNSLGFTGVTAENLATVQHVIQLAASDAYVDNRTVVQDLINANLGTSLYSALAVIAHAAYNNSATAETLGANIYATAGVTGVNSSNLDSINSALNSEAITMPGLSRTADVQALVNAYDAILASADGMAGNTVVALTGAQYAAVGVGGISGTATPGTALHLLNDVVDARTRSAVDTVPELQALADAANHVMAAVGGTAASAAALTFADLGALGIYGLENANLAQVQSQLQTRPSGAAVDTLDELQTLVSATRIYDTAPDTFSSAVFSTGPTAPNWTSFSAPVLLA